MKKNKLKGFTLIECIVALAIIGIASLMMAQIYSSIALINKNNAKLNETLSSQMVQAENEIIAKTGDVDVVMLTNYSVDSTNEAYKKIQTEIGAGSIKQNVSNCEIQIEATKGDSKAKFTKISADIDIDVVIYKSSDTAIASGKDSTIRYMFLRPAEYKNK